MTIRSGVDGCDAGRGDLLHDRWKHAEDEFDAVYRADHKDEDGGD